MDLPQVFTSYISTKSMSETYKCPNDRVSLSHSVALVFLLPLSECKFLVQSCIFTTLHFVVHIPHFSRTLQQQRVQIFSFLRFPPLPSINLSFHLPRSLCLFIVSPCVLFFPIYIVALLLLFPVTLHPALRYDYLLLRLMFSLLLDITNFQSSVDFPLSLESTILTFHWFTSFVNIHFFRQISDAVRNKRVMSSVKHADSVLIGYNVLQCSVWLYSMNPNNLLT